MKLLRLVTAGWVACACGSAWVGGCQSARPQPRATLAAVDAGADPLATVRRLFFAAADGDAASLRQCSVELRGFSGDDAKADAYRGGCRMLEAARAPFPWDKGRLSRDGLALLDGAVERAPEDLEVRFVRGMTSYHLPRFMGRGETAAGDLAAVANGAEEAVESRRLDVTAACAALFHYGRLLERRGDRTAASTVWRRSAALGPDTRGGKAAARALSGERAAASARPQSSAVLSPAEAISQGAGSPTWAQSVGVRLGEATSLPALATAPPAGYRPACFVLRTDIP